MRLFHRWLQWFGRVEGTGWLSGTCRVVQGPAVRRVSAIVWKSAASGQALAKATRMRLAVSTTRAAILSRRKRMVANSAVRSMAFAGMAWRSFHISQ